MTLPVHPRHLLTSINRYFTTGNFVKILVGPEKKEWTLNEEFLCDKVEYFKAAFQSGFKETEEKWLELPEDSSEMFRLFVAWIYTGQITCDECTGRDVRSEWGVSNPETDGKHDLTYFGLWVFGDKIGPTQLAIDALERCKMCLRYNGLVVSAEGVKFVYSNTNERSPLRELVVNATVQRFYNYRIERDSGALAELIAANENFGTATMRQLGKHLGAGTEHCSITDCCIHDLYMRDESDEIRVERFPPMIGYKGDDGEYL